MIGYFAMLDEGELEGLRSGTIDMEEFLSRIVRDEERCLDLDKAWSGLHFLLSGGTAKEEAKADDPILGGERIGDEDIGFGPARVLGRESVRSVAERLAATDFGAFRGLFLERVLGNEEVYPCHEDEEDFNYLEYNFAALAAFYGRCAGSGKDMLLFIA